MRNGEDGDPMLLSEAEKETSRQKKTTLCLCGRIGSHFGWNNTLGRDQTRTHLGGEAVCAERYASRASLKLQSSPFKLRIPVKIEKIHTPSRSAEHLNCVQALCLYGVGETSPDRVCPQCLSPVEKGTLFRDMDLCKRTISNAQSCLQ